jgi:thiamine-monophosphate kinase
MKESAFIDSLKAIATHPAARGLADDCAVLEVGGETLVLTHDTLVEGVHFLPTDPPETVAWKLIAVSLSDLAAKGATPIGALVSYCLRDDPTWDAQFADGLAQVLETFGVALLGGDTVREAPGVWGCRMLGATLIGKAGAPVPSRSGAREGDALFVTGTIGDAGIGLLHAREKPLAVDAFVEAYRRPQPQLAAGQALAGSVTAIMDISDGLLIDAQRMATASGVAVMIDLDAIPLSALYSSIGFGHDRIARIDAATAGDDYQLLFTSAHPLPPLPCQVTRIGQMVRGQGLQLHDRDGEVPLPTTLGWEH